MTMALFMLVVGCCANLATAIYPPGGPDVDLGLQMAWLAEWPIGWAKASGWDQPELWSHWTRVDRIDIESSWVGELDHYALSETTNADKMCAITISGTNAISDFQENLAITFSESFCGFSGVHRGVMYEVEDLLNHTNYTNIWKPLLTGETGDNCSGGIYIAGHSLGGAQASLLAACANNPNSTLQLGYEVAGLYTFGAFAPSKPALRNMIWKKQEQADGCFAGARYYNQDSGNYDVVPGTTTIVGFEHPQVKPLMLSRRYS